jgi:hypothetical protein
MFIMIGWLRHGYGAVAGPHITHQGFVTVGQLGISDCRGHGVADRVTL